MKKYFFLLFLVIPFVFLSCSSGGGNGDVVRSMYYWSTDFSLSHQQRDFIGKHHVKRLYLRYFDVVLNKDDEAMPNATCTFSDSVPKGVKVIPTVFIMNDVMRHVDDSLAMRIFHRIMQMSETNDVVDIDEIQIDCDWTSSTEKVYFSFLFSPFSPRSGFWL